jgi:hypothetical protein
VPIVLRFWASDDPAKELAQWRGFIGHYRDLFERAARLSPTTPGGRRAQRALSAVAPAAPGGADRQP